MIIYVPYSDADRNWKFNCFTKKRKKNSNGIFQKCIEIILCFTGDMEKLNLKK